MTQVDAIFILAGGLRKDTQGRWHTTSFDDAGDFFGALGDRLRVEAAYFLAQDQSCNGKIVCVGGKGQYADIPDVPPVAEVMKKELLELGVTEEQLETETNSGNSFEALEAIAEIVTQKRCHSGYVISNEYHLERLRTMVQMNQKWNNIFKDHNISLVSAEKIVLDFDKEKYNEQITKAYASEAMQARIALEKKGVEDLKKGTYKHS